MKKVLDVFLVAVGVLVVAGLLAGSFYVWRAWDAASRIERSDTLLPDVADPERPAEAATQPGSLNVVLMGSDARSDDERGRSDVLMLAHVPPSRDRVYLVSFPRDMWVTIPGRGENKINAAYAWGGEALAAKTLESLVGVRMDHAVKIDFEGFSGLTRALGGVSVDNRVGSTFLGYTWPKGTLTLSGEEALMYVRQRHALPGGDLDRAERQRRMVQAIGAKLLSRDILANPAAFNAVMADISHYFTVDSGLTNERMLEVASGLKMADGSDIVILQAPISGFGTSAAGASIDIVNEAQMAELGRAIREGTMAEYAAKYRNQPYSGRG